MSLKCVKCQSENIRSYDNGTLFHPNWVQISEGTMRYDSEIVVYFECKDCDKQWNELFDVTPKPKEISRYINKVILLTDSIHNHLNGSQGIIIHAEYNDANEIIFGLNIPHPEDVTTFLWVNISEGEICDERNTDRDYEFNTELGSLICNENGVVIEIKGTIIGGKVFNDESLMDIAKINIVEYHKYLERNEVTHGECTDLKYVGFWKKDGTEVKRELPMCIKINGKIFLHGSERYEVVVNDNDLNMIELFDITTEMETGDSYQIFVSDISYFEVASDEERQVVLDFFDRMNIELFPN